VIRAGVRALLLHRDDVDSPDVGFAGEQVIGELSESLRDLPVQLGIASRLGLEAVEDAVVGVIDLECVPGHGVASATAGARPAIRND
jgi:hypothetical protein